MSREMEETGMRARELERVTNPINGDVYRYMSNGIIQLMDHRADGKERWTNYSRCHFIERSGELGCLLDHMAVSSSYYACVDSLAELFDLSRRQCQELRRTGYLELGPKYGAAYCSIDACNCGDPLQHDDMPDKYQRDEWKELGYYRDEEEIDG